MPDEEKNRKFLEFLSIIRETVSENNRCARAFLIALRRGQAGRDEAIAPDNPDPVNEELAFELGLQLKPIWKEVDKAIRAAVIAYLVDIILVALGLKR